jgi:hypothetical protein
MFNQLIPLTVVILCNLFCISTLPIIRAFKDLAFIDFIITSVQSGMAESK